MESFLKTNCKLMFNLKLILKKISSITRLRASIHWKPETNRFFFFF